MKKVRLLNNKYQEYCKYREHAYDAFFDFVNANKLKVKKYKNGNIDVWFNKTAFNYGSYLINNMKFESVALEVTGK